MKVPNPVARVVRAAVSLSRLQNEGSQPYELFYDLVSKSIKATE